MVNEGLVGEVIFSWDLNDRKELVVWGLGVEILRGGIVSVKVLGGNDFYLRELERSEWYE